MSTVGSRLKVWRECLSLRQSDAANLIGLSGSTFQNYERDVRQPNAESLTLFVRAGINVNWLLTGEGPMLLGDYSEAGKMPKPRTYVRPPPENARVPPGKWLVAVRERARAELMATFDFFLAWKYDNRPTEEAFESFADSYNQGEICSVIGLDTVAAGWLRDLYIAWRSDDWTLTGMANVILAGDSQGAREVTAALESVGAYAMRRAAEVVKAVKVGSEKGC